MSPAERQRRHREKARNNGLSGTQVARVHPPASDHTAACDTRITPAVNLQLDPETIAAKVVASVVPEKADAIARSITQRLTVWRCGSFDLRLIPRRQ